MQGNISLPFEAFDVILAHLKYGQYNIVEPIIKSMEEQLMLQKQHLAAKREREQQAETAQVGGKPAGDPKQNPK